jgi:hypothetical protein
MLGHPLEIIMSFLTHLRSNTLSHTAAHAMALLGSLHQHTQSPNLTLGSLLVWKNSSYSFTLTPHIGLPCALPCASIISLPNSASDPLFWNCPLTLFVHLHPNLVHSILFINKIYVWLNIYTCD